MYANAYGSIQNYTRLKKMLAGKVDLKGVLDRFF